MYECVHECECMRYEVLVCVCMVTMNGQILTLYFALQKVALVCAMGMAGVPWT